MLSEYFDVVAVSSPGDDLEIVRRREKVRTVAIPMERRISLLKDFVSLLRLIMLFHKEHPDAVHSMTPKAGLLAMIAGFVTRVPVRIHTFTGLVFPTRKGIMHELLKNIDRLICYCSTFINPESQGVRRDLLNYGVTSKPLEIIANGNIRGIDLDYYNRTPDVQKKSELIRDKQKITFCFTGRIVGDKGINELIRAFVRLYSERKDIRLLLVGDYEIESDPLEQESLDLINEYDSIIVTGMQMDVRPYLAASDIFILPSYREGMPNSVIEAGSFGLPCIVTDINGSNEIIKEGINGQIIPPKDEIALFNTMKKWINNPLLVKEMGGRARHLIAERYDQKIVWNALLRVYQQII